MLLLLMLEEEEVAVVEEPVPEPVVQEPGPEVEVSLEERIRKTRPAPRTQVRT
jgi:hypothetical protein